MDNKMPHVTKGWDKDWNPICIPDCPACFLDKKHELTGSEILEPYLQELIQCVRELADYGYAKHGHNSIQGRIIRNDRNREYDRLTSSQIIAHAQEHGNMYLRGDVHDHFGTLKHQLAAMIINPIMEYYLANLSIEGKCPRCGIGVDTNGDGDCLVCYKRNKEQNNES